MKKLLLIGTFVSIMSQTQAQQIFAPEIKWQFTKSDSVIHAIKIVETDDHNSVLLYENSITSEGFLEEVDSAGNILWKTYLDISNTENETGRGFFDLKKIPGGYIVCGGFNLNRVILIKLNKNGSILWSKNYPEFSFILYGFSVDLVGDSSYIVSGIRKPVGSTNGPSNSFLMKIDTAGIKLWHKNHYLNNTTVEVLFPKVITLSNGFGQLVVCGLNNAPYSSEYFLRTNETGDSIYSYTFPYPFHPTAFAKSKYDNSLMFITQNWDTSGIYLAQNYSTFKLDSNGLFLSKKDFFWPGLNGLPPEIQVKKDSGFIAVTTKGADIYKSTYYVRIDENGDTVGIKKIGGDLGHSFNTTCFVPTEDDGCVIAGPEKDSSMFCYCPDGRSRFLKLGPDHWTSTVVNTLEKEKIDLNIYPNPTTGNVTIQLQNFTGKEDLNFFLYDIAGKLFLTQKITSNKSVVSLMNLPAGYYLYEVNKIGKGKLILIK